MVILLPVEVIIADKDKDIIPQDMDWYSVRYCKSGYLRGGWGVVVIKYVFSTSNSTRGGKYGLTEYSIYYIKYMNS